MNMQQQMTAYVEGITELMEDSDYSRFTWGGDVTQEVIRAAAVVVYREAGGSLDLDDSMEAEAEVISVLNRGWVTYDTLAEMASEDEDGDQLNSLMTQFGFPSAERDAADERVGRALITKARESGETVVWYDDKDAPESDLIPGITVFNRRVG